MQKGNQYKSNFNGETIILPLSTVELLPLSSLDKMTFIQEVEIEGEEPKQQVSKNKVKPDDTNIEKA